MKFFISYLYSHIRTIVCFVLLCLVFATVFVLYRQSIEPILYSCFLCFILLVFFVIFDYSKQLKKYKLLNQLKNNIIYNINGLPRPCSPVEQEYNELILLLCEANSSAKSKYDYKISDMIDYYTVWAHQIKTPISAMRLLLQTNQNSGNREISLELFRIEQYVEMVLGYLRLDSNVNDFVIQNYSLDDIIRQSVKNFSKIFIIKKISLNFTETQKIVLTDKKWLQFVIEQILSNSLKYTEKGSISILYNNDELIITDTGIGISKEDIPRVFERGYTGYNGRSENKSTGIGLYICKKICNKLGHKIDIKSEVGQGTSVYLKLDSIKIEIE